MKDIQALVSAVVAHAERRPETIWDTVYDAMTRADIAAVVGSARTRRDAVRMMEAHLNAASERVLVLA